VALLARPAGDPALGRILRNCSAARRFDTLESGLNREVRQVSAACAGSHRLQQTEKSGPILNGELQMRKVLLVAMLAVATLAAPAAWAQRGGGRGGFDGGGFMLLGQKSVQQELKLSDEQVTKVTAQMEKQREGFAELRDLDREERMAKMRERMEANNTALKEILNADQLKRLKQIGLQQRGASALADPQVATDLGLTDEQKEKVRAIQEENRGALRGAGGDGDREAMRKKFEEQRASTNAKLEALLTPEQQTKWKELQGEPFKGEIVRPQFRGRNRAAGRFNPRGGELISLSDDRDAERDALWRQIAHTLEGRPDAAKFGFEVTRGEAPLQLAGVHHPPRPNPAKIRRKVHRQNARRAHWASNDRSEPRFVRDDEVAIAGDSLIRPAVFLTAGTDEVPVTLTGANEPPKANGVKSRRHVHRHGQHGSHWSRHRAVRYHRGWQHHGPRHHGFAANAHGRHHHHRHFANARHGHHGHHFAAHRFHGPRPPHFSRGGDERARHYFAGRLPGGPGQHLHGWGGPHRRPGTGPGPGAFAHHRPDFPAPGFHRPGHHGPQAHFAHHHGGQPFHMPSWHRHRGESQRRDADRPHGDHERNKQERDRREKEGPRTPHDEKDKGRPRD